MNNSNCKYSAYCNIAFITQINWVQKIVATAKEVGVPPQDASRRTDDGQQTTQSAY